MSTTLDELWDAARWRLRSWEEIRSMSWMTSANYTNFFLLITFVAMAIYQARTKVKAAQKASFESSFRPAPEFPEIERLQGFSWKEAEPLKLRAFKPKYHLTMVDASALEKLNPSELILMDKNYASRLAYRQKIIRENRGAAIGINEQAGVAPAVRELYSWLMGTYLPKRYPAMFTLHKTAFESGDAFMLENTTTHVLLPAEAPKESNPAALLENLGKTFDEDFLFLMPEDETQVSEGQTAKYRLQAYVACCPSGFDLRQKIGKRLASIHDPVPAYKDKIEGSMDRFFSRLEAGEYVKRSNWSITTNPELFVLPGDGSNHLHEGEEVQDLATIDPSNTFLRCERQTLHRLPRSKALVFAFKTYMDPLQDIKAEGLGDDLAQAVDGLGAGNAPGMHFYKRGVVWGTAVKNYLRS